MLVRHTLLKYLKILPKPADFHSRKNDVNLNIIEHDMDLSMSFLTNSSFSVLAQILTSVLDHYAIQVTLLNIDIQH